MYAEGRGLLKVVGIIVIIQGLINLLLTVPVFFASQNAMDVVASVTANYNPTVIKVCLILEVVFGVLWIATGIISIIFSNEPTKANFIIILVAIGALVHIADVFLTIVMGFPVGSNLFTSLIAVFVLSILLVIGAIKNKFSA